MIVLSIILYTIPYTTTPAHAQQPLQQELPKPKPWKLLNQIDNESKQAWGMDHINPYEVIAGLRCFQQDISWASIKGDGDIVPYTREIEGVYYSVIYDIEQSPTGRVYGVGFAEYYYYDPDQYRLDLLEYSLSGSTWYKIESIETLVKTNAYIGHAKFPMQISVFNDIVVVARVKEFELKVYGLSTTGNTIWDKSYTLPYSDVSAHKAFAIARYNSTLVLALLSVSGEHEVVNVHHINASNGGVVYNTSVTLPANKFWCCF